MDDEWELYVYGCDNYVVVINNSSLVNIVLFKFIVINYIGHS